MNWEKELKIAVEAATEAGKIQMEYRGTALNVEWKPDRSPVTEADKRCEARIREIILGAFPDDGFLGEESGAVDTPNMRRWIVDPIDGTRPFIRGIPTHSALIALEEDGAPTVGVIHLPGMGITCSASKGGGTFLNGEKIGVSSIDKLSAAMGSALGTVEYADEPTGRQLIDFMRSLDYIYGFMDAYSYVLLACGKLDACVNLLDKPWDCAAAACIVSEAGGQYSTITGEQTVHGDSFVITNGILHNQVLEFFRYGEK
ncbi:MAG: inositol monophosphatase [Chitinispirillales bacterium]|nr:inositol monophosphatase [Chitinispirillales bacterium]